MADEDPEIAELVARAQAGDAAAIGDLYDRHVERLYRFARFRVGNPHDAEDLVQAVFVKMIEALPRYQPRGIPFAAWLFRIARNATIDLRRGTRPVEPLDALAERPAAGRGPEELAITASEIRGLETALKALTDEQRDVIAYRFFAGLSAREAGAVMGRREGTIRALQFRAVAALRREMLERRQEPDA